VSHRKVTRSFQVRILETWEKFLEICEKEGTSGSEKLEELLTQYVKDHWPGNPQRDLGVFLSPSPRRTVCPDGERGLCPTRYRICVLRKRYACKFGP